VGQGVLAIADAEESYNLVRTWMGECFEAHDCGHVPKKSLGGRLRGQRLGPTRLIDVGQKGVSREPSFVEVVRFSDIKYCRYAALSYCRDDSNPTTLPRVLQASCFKKLIQGE
jgi:hypothetical protein